ncbi:hypothetical protein HNQ39_003871 [Armatimonas rosea]|uniref:Uncharacterized protein n=1 Tax=Armatimonas rosea TaxID=685828 RepID=A0A7W9SSJ5_ARMRO|nr:hypothetical protein [Armatimonas rosea]
MALRINLIPERQRPGFVIRQRKLSEVKHCVCAPAIRPFIWLATLVAILAQGIFVLLVAILAVPLGAIAGVLLTPLWLWFAFHWLRDIYRDGGAPFFRWCIVVECAPEEVAALAQTLDDQVDRQESPSWLVARSWELLDMESRRNTRSATDGIVLRNGFYAGRKYPQQMCYPTQPGAVFYGGRLTMHWLADKLRAAQIPCHVVWRHRRFCGPALRVQPETLHDDWVSLIAQWTWASQSPEPENRTAGVLKNGSWLG